MPLYWYKCPAHGSFEVLIKLEDHGQQQPCPKCGYLSKGISTAPARTPKLWAK